MPGRVVTVNGGHLVGLPAELNTETCPRWQLYKLLQLMRLQWDGLDAAHRDLYDELEALHVQRKAQDEWAAEQKRQATELARREREGWPKLVIKCPYCLYPYTAEMKLDLDHTEGCETCGHGGGITGTIDIHCAHCGKLVYRKEVDEL